MNRRTFLITAAAALAFPMSAYAQADALASAFEGLSPSARLVAQEKLSAGGFYSGRLDGAFGPGTRSALMNAAAFTRDNSYGRADFDLTSPKGASGFLTALATGELDKYLWGEGDEEDGG